MWSTLVQRLIYVWEGLREPRTGLCDRPLFLTFCQDFPVANLMLSRMLLVLLIPLDLSRSGLSDTDCENSDVYKRGGVD